MAQILVAEDHPHNRTVFAAVLGPLGHQVEFAVDGEQALELLHKKSFDLLLLDVRMPKLDGFQVLQRLRAQPGLEGLPVVLVTAGDAPEQRLRGFSVGATDFLSKPLDASLLVLRVKTHLTLRATARALVERNAQLEALQEHQRDTAAFIVHDLKSPLSVISANLQWIRAELGGTQSDLLEAIDDSSLSARRMLELIGDLLVLGKAASTERGIEAHPADTDLDRLLSMACADRSREAKDKNIHLTVQSIPGLQAKLDAGLLRRLVDNLIDNALRYTPARGAIRVSAKVDGGVELVVANTGSPMPATTRLHIFDRYKRGANTGSEITSVGLGLYFCRLVAEAHGGTIAVDSSEEWPTLFRVTLPRSS